MSPAIEPARPEAPSGLGTKGAVEALGAWIAGKLGVAAASVVRAEPLSGGAIQENWLLTCRIEGGEGATDRRFVLRRDAAATIASSLSRAEEFAVLRVAFDAGVLVPIPVGHCDDEDVLGSGFTLVGAVDGVGLGPRVVKDAGLGGDRDALAERLGLELAKIHGVRPPHPALSFLGEPPPDPALAAVGQLRGALDRLGVARPALEWGLRWAELQAPPAGEPVLLHNDFRTGNYMVDAEGLTAILDWEFAAWGDPMADLGWFCARCWRFGRPDLEAGGIAPREAFYRGYQAGGGRIDDAAVRYWELVAHLRWAVIALQQGERHASGRQRSLELALTSRIVPELELAILRATEPEQWGANHAR